MFLKLGSRPPPLPIIQIPKSLDLQRVTVVRGDASGTKSNFHLSAYAQLIDLPSTTPLLQHIFGSLSEYLAAGSGGDVVLAGAIETGHGLTGSCVGLLRILWQLFFEGFLGDVCRGHWGSDLPPVVRLWDWTTCCGIWWLGFLFLSINCFAVFSVPWCCSWPASTFRKAKEFAKEAYWVRNVFDQNLRTYGIGVVWHEFCILFGIISF